MTTFLEMNRTIHAYPERVLVGEILYYLEPEQINAYYGDGKGLDLPFYFGLMFLPMEADTLRAKIDAYDAAIGENHPNYNLANHDMPRPESAMGRGRGLAAMLLLTLRGTPFLYYGDELNMPNVEVPPEKQQDPLHRLSDGYDQRRHAHADAVEHRVRTRALRGKEVEPPGCPFSEGL